MTVRGRYLGSAAWLLVPLLWIGCATGNPSPTSSGHAKADPVKLGDAEIERRVRTAAHYATGLSYELNEKPDLALEEFLRAAQSDPTYEPVVIEAARRCLREQKTDKAIEILSKATSSPNASGELYAWLGLAYAQAGRTDLAIKANRTAIRKSPQSLAPYQNLAQIYLQSSRTNEAVRVLDDAAKQPADNPGFLIDLAELYLRLGHSQSAPNEPLKPRLEKLLDRANDLGPSNPVQVLRLADDYFSLGEFKKAEPLYKQLLDEHPELPSLRGKLTEIYLRSGQKDKAAQQLSALAESEPTNPQAYVFLGALNADEKKFAEAAENFERALKLDPDLEQVYYDLASLKIALGKPDEAVALLDKAHTRFKLSFPLEFYSGLAYSAAKKYDDALKYFTSAEAVAKATDPKRLNEIFYFQLGATYERKGNLADAEKAFRQCLTLAPEDAEALNYLGYMWAEHGMNLPEAHDLIEKAVRLQPNNSAFLDSLAWVLFKLHKPKEALPPMLKAIETTDKPDPTLYDHLGDIYSSMQQYDQAREAWSKALKVEPNDQIQEKLKTAPSVAVPSTSAH